MSFRSSSITDDQIATKFGTCHDSPAVVPCAKYCSDHFISIWMRAKWNFHHIWNVMEKFMMTSSNGNIFRVTSPLCGEFTGPGEFPAQRPVTQSFDVFFDLRLNKRLSKQPWGWWFETASWSLWRQCNVLVKWAPGQLNPYLSGLLH